MSLTKYLKGECTHCGGRIEFSVDAIGTTVDCPHCGKATELTLATPPEESSEPRKAIVWTVVAVLILGLGLAGAMAALKRAQRLATARQKERVVAMAPATNASPQSSTGEAASQKEFQISAISFEKTPGTSLVHAVGTVNNLAARQRFGVKVELDLFDTAGHKIGIATDYQQVIEPRAQWRFNAPVIDSKAVSAALASIKEDQ